MSPQESRVKYVRHEEILIVSSGCSESDCCSCSHEHEQQNRNDYKAYTCIYLHYILLEWKIWVLRRITAEYQMFLYSTVRCSFLCSLFGICRYEVPVSTTEESSDIIVVPVYMREKRYNVK